MVMIGWFQPARKGLINKNYYLLKIEQRSFKLKYHYLPGLLLIISISKKRLFLHICKEFACMGVGKESLQNRE